MWRSLAALAFWAAGVRAATPPVFNHKLHAPIGLACTLCHSGAEKAARAGMPPASRCLVCHKGTLNLSANARPFRAEYDNLPDYVRFSHARHARGKVACKECHGDVSKQEQTEPANALNMHACVDCHTAHKATVACGVCHRIR
jgi:hypothetical protein